FLGRVMAHSMWSEFSKIQKEANVAQEVCGPVTQAIQKVAGTTVELDLNQLAEKRAYDLLAENGYVDEQGYVLPPQKTAGRENFEQVVEQLARQKLAEMGY
ncbi:MAG: hypothetical protein ACFFD4_39870, partial [Candidatus Odinarchaeota archaeon]